MANGKKSIRKSKGRKQQNPSSEIQEPAKDSTFRESSTEDPNQKVQSLQSLNALLVKQAYENRHQIEYLVQANETLGAELTQSMSSELQNGLLWVYMASQMKEMGGALDSRVNELICTIESERERLSLACKERDLARNDFELQVNECSLMKDKIMAMEEKERKLGEEIGKLKVECDRFLGEIEELEKVKSLMAEEKDLMEKNIEDLVQEVETFRRKIETFEKEKEVNEMERNKQRMKIGELEKETRELSEVVLNLRKEEGILRAKALELEKNCREAMDREAEQAKEIGSLLEEKRAIEMCLDRLKEEKDSASKSLELATAESEDRQRRIEKLLEEQDAARTELETNRKELKDLQNKVVDFLEEFLGEVVSGENENSEPQEDMSDLWIVVNRLFEACWAHNKKNEELLSEVSNIRVSFDQLTLEKDNTLKVLDEEKMNGVNLKLKVSEMEKLLEETTKELAHQKTEWQDLMKEKKDIESRCGSMAEDIDRLQKELLEAKSSFNDLRAKMESTSMSYRQLLTLLKNTASLLCDSKDEKNGKEKEEAAISQKKLEDEIEPIATNLEAIKQAFKNKETVAQDLNLKVAVMEKTIVEVEKKKSYWTLVSSATTILAAVTFAYAAKRR
ncbi:Detected protein of unknown function [Hibiscus syriacus]|uniref:Uncharacterized protein n=1 Tax=Hibiscus syriacus TaxID=106335 RepID=A0A6A2YHP9_HIBSY|nr:MAR-binding filament-like protein 1-1 [Hibiscus syriacus]KAE8675507.1 Detected protein of unknown function [Hibiscus syriacus]